MEERHQHFERPTTKRPPSLINLTIWAVLVGFVAGFGGYLLANYLLPTDTGGYFNINPNNRDINVSIDQPLTNISNEYQQSIGGVYKNLRSNPAIGKALFSEDDFLGSAVVVTSDGWLMTTNQVAINTNVIVVLGDQEYEVQEVVQDKFSSLVFLKINEDFLQPIDFQLTDDINVAEKLFTSVDNPNSYNHSFFTTYLSNPHYAQNKYLFTDVVDYYVKLEDSNGYLASPYFNLDGHLIGILYNVDNEDLLIPAEYVKQSIKHLLNGTERPSIGIRYVDMENNSGFDRKGSLVYNPQYSSIVYNSPAYKAGIKAGDQIVAVNNSLVSSSRTLTSILQDYRPGDVVIFKILREEEEQDIEVSL